MSDGYDYGDPYDRHPTPELPPGWLVFIVACSVVFIVACLIRLFVALIRAVMQ